MMALRKSLLERFLYAIGTKHWSNLQQSAQHNHVKHRTILHLGSLVHGVNLIHGDVLTRRLLDDAKAVVDQDATRLDFRLKLLQRRLVQHYGNIVFAEDGR